MDRIGLLKGYLKRLGAGESLESVRRDFVEQFKDVEASEIMKAEQEMLAEGTPLSEVQKLCDVHAALFYGSAREDRIANGQAAVNVSALREKRAESMKGLLAIEGHPLQIFIMENDELEKRLERIKAALKSGTVDRSLLESVREVSIHYAKKGDLIYPLLKVKYKISGPSDVMWTTDDEIRDELAALAKQQEIDEEWKNRFRVVVGRIKEMIGKENNILFPNCASNFSEEDWICMYHDQKDYGICFGVERKIWNQAEQSTILKNMDVSGTEVILPGGHMTMLQLTALLNTLPFEITFVDADNINRFFNEGPKDFKRPSMAIDRDVFSCHPPKVEEKVRYIISAFREGTLNEVPVWMEKNGKCMLVRYIAVRDKEKKYLGTLELVQDMEFAKNHFRP